MNHFEPSTTPAEGTGVLYLFRLVDTAVPDFFAPDRRVVIARAPGRLDVMGGIADYSGSLVLQLPLADAACVALQARPDDELHVWSPCRDGSRSQLVSMRLEDLGLTTEPMPYAQARALLAAEPRDRWAAYLLGGLLVLAHERGLRPKHGFAMLLRSDVPEGAGVASSAAIEVAAMRAMAEVYGVELDARELALLCQQVENEVVGAACGVMDQMVAVSGQADELLALRCQPCEVEDSVAVPQELEFIGVDSGVRHAVGGADYTSVRIGAFLGARMLQEESDWRGCLANCDPAAFEARLAALPERMMGADFLARYGAHVDAHTVVEPGREYPVRMSTRHPIEENARVERFRELLRGSLDADVRRELGELMFASHASYSACGLGNEVTDFLVEHVRQRRDAGAGVYGAKITGGGSGGTVALLGERGQVWFEALRLKKALLGRTGHSASIFRWSSPGALPFGTVLLTPR